MRFGKLAVISALLVLPWGYASGQVYKCPGPGGVVQFSDKPCGGGAETEANRIEVRPVEVGGSFGVSEEQQDRWERAPSAPARPAAPPRRNYCKSYSSTSLRSIIVGNGVEAGMTTGDVRKSWGSPAVVNGGYPEQWVYRWPAGTSYVYFVGGCVWQVDGGYRR